MFVRISALAAFALLINSHASAQQVVREPNPVLGLTHAEKFMPDMANYQQTLIKEEDYWCKNLACRKAFEDARIASIALLHAGLAQDLADIRRDKNELVPSHAAWVAAKAKSNAAYDATRKFVMTTGSK